MKYHKKFSETTKDPEGKKISKSSGWIKTTTLAIMGLFASCDNVPSDQIILNIDEGSEKFSVEYKFSESSGGATLIDYNIFVHKNGETFEGNIEQSDGWISNITKIESDNVDGLFDEIANKLDHDFITDNTRDKKDKKVAFAKQAYKDNVLNNKEHSKGKRIIRYKK